MSYDTSKKAKGIANYKLMAEVVVGLYLNLEKKNELEIVMFDNSTDYRGIYMHQNKHLDKSFFRFNDRSILSKTLLRKLSQTVKINFDYNINLDKIKIYKTLNTVVVVVAAQSSDQVVEYHTIALKGRILHTSSLLAAVVPITVKQENFLKNNRIFTEKVWWFDLNVVNSF